MRAIDLIVIVAIAGFAFLAGDSFRADRIQVTCESNDRPTVINGTEYLCLSRQQVERLQQQQRSNWRGA